MASTDAVDYLVRCTNWISDICGNQSAMSYIGLNNYCANTLLADADWRDGIIDSTYMESVLNAKVPTMTSNTTPSGEVSASSLYSDRQYFYLFDGVYDPTHSLLFSNNSVGQWFKYMFVDAIKVSFIKFTWYNGLPSQSPITFKVQGSNDDSEWSDLYEGSFESPYIGNNDPRTQKYIFTNSTNYKYYRVYFTKTVYIGGDARQFIGFEDAQFYGRADI